MALTDVWFGLIAVLFTGYFFLDGFDFGVGILLPVLGRKETDRRVMINTIGPVWDGNEVWLLVAGGAMFAAFPEWYASLFSGFYLALLLILLALIVRGVAFEYRGHGDTARWRAGWDQAIFWGSAVPALLWGVAFANIVRGVPLDRDHNFTGTLLTLLNPYALLGGTVTLGLFTLHGAFYLALKTDGDVRVAANALARRIAAPIVVVSAGFLLWTQLRDGKPVSWALTAAAAAALLGGVAASWRGREGWAFIGTGLSVALAVASIFATLYPDVLPSTTDESYGLTTTNASSTDYTLTVMTWVAVVLVPFVLLYQGWTYWVFRRRISDRHLPAAEAPSRAMIR
ncbi:MAG: cytochrome d ubiquinol oxidase subunit II [Sporichthyaceae bacterium]